jgi:hypothetical protein
MASIFGDDKAAYTNPDPENASTLEEKMKRGDGSIKMVPSNSGIYHTYVPMKELTFKIAPNESVIQHQGAYITLGTDRPGGLTSGLGGQGYGATSTIDLVVGRGSAANGGEGPKAGSIINNMFSADAARVYISQLTDVDKNFGIANGVPGSVPGLPRYIGSAVAIKADDVRMIATNSLKIITGRGDGFEGHGRRGEPNSQGGKSQTGPTIQLIAGNYSDSDLVYGGIKKPFDEIAYLQPAIKGHNLLIALRELYNVVMATWSGIYNMGLIQSGFNSIVGVDPYRDWVSAAAPPAGLGQMTFVMQNLWSARTKGAMWEQNYLEPHAPRYIASPNIWLT